MNMISNDRGLLTTESRNEPANRLKQKQPASASAVPSSRSSRTGDAVNHKAWVAQATNQPMMLETVDHGPLGAEDVEVAVEHCGLCHSDRRRVRLRGDRVYVEREQVRGGEGFRANHVVSNRDSAAIKKLGGSFDLLIRTVNVKLDWDAMIGTLAPNGRLHVVGAVLEPIPVAAFAAVGFFTREEEMRHA